MFKEHMRAAEHIRVCGVEGANDAALLVGVDAVIVMLLTSLEGDEEQRMAALREAGLTDFADVDLLSGRAVIYNEDGDLIAALEVKDGACVEIPTQGLHVPMWMQGTGEIKKLFAGNQPYASLKELILREHDAVVKALLTRS